VTGQRIEEVNFDGLVGPTHNYAGLAPGNLASLGHGGDESNPRAAALQGLEKMWHVAQLGVPQAVLPPQPRPDVATLRRFGFSGSDATVLRAAADASPRVLAQVSSASSMWTANAATVTPSADARDGRVHFVPANLASMLHRQLEVATTTRLLRSIFSDGRLFRVHDWLPPLVEYGDEGAANHTRLETSRGVLHLFAWGRDFDTDHERPVLHPARQSRAASVAVARLAALPDEICAFVQQHPTGIDSGAFHTDVLAVGNQNLLLMHESAFFDADRVEQRLRSRLGQDLCIVRVTDAELSAADAIAAYPFNSQLMTLPNGSMVIVAPTESRDNAAAAAFLSRVVDEDNPVSRVDYLDVRQSMSNGGGPACLRLRVPLTAEQRLHLGARVVLDEALFADLSAWVIKHYRDRLGTDDLRDVSLLEESRIALDELTQIMQLGSVYDFQRGAD
jgi:succinylarginine dihydrolase